MDFHTALKKKDLKNRIANYEAVYETMSDTEQVRDMSRKKKTNQCVCVCVWKDRQTYEYKCVHACQQNLPHYATREP